MYASLVFASPGGKLPPNSTALSSSTIVRVKWLQAGGRIDHVKVGDVHFPKKIKQHVVHFCLAQFSKI
jgi:hypothetical protein